MFRRIALLVLGVVVLQTVTAKSLRKSKDARKIMKNYIDMSVYPAWVNQGKRSTDDYDNVYPAWVYQNARKRSIDDESQEDRKRSTKDDDLPWIWDKRSTKDDDLPWIWNKRSTKDDDLPWIWNKRSTAEHWVPLYPAWVNQGRKRSIVPVTPQATKRDAFGSQRVNPPFGKRSDINKAFKMRAGWPTKRSVDEVEKSLSPSFLGGSLIPFPRTGKRSVDEAKRSMQPSHGELDEAKRSMQPSFRELYQPKNNGKRSESMSEEDLLADVDEAERILYPYTLTYNRHHPHGFISQSESMSEEDLLADVDEAERILYPYTNKRNKAWRKVMG